MKYVLNCELKMCKIENKIVYTLKKSLQSQKFRIL